MHPTWSSHLDHDVYLCVADASANPAQAGSATTMQIELEIRAFGTGCDCRYS